MAVLDDKVAVVTGGALGIGGAISQKFAAEGARVAVWDIDEEASANMVAKIEAAGGTCIAIRADVADRTEAASALAQTLDAFGHVDIHVNNVGIFNGFWRFLDIPEDAWNDMMRVNLGSPFICSQLVGRHMVEKKIEGRIINIGSVDGEIPYQDFAHYAVSKAAMRLLSQAMALSLAEHQITVNEIAPGFILTELSKFVIEAPPFQSRVKSFAPLGRAGTTEEVADAALYLASPQASYVTGAILTIDGGSVIAGRSYIQHQYLIEDGMLP